MRNQRGSITVLGIIMMLLLGSMGATLVMLCITHLQIATNHRDGIAAQYWAEAGMEDGIAILKTNEDFVNQTQIHTQVFTVKIPNPSSTIISYTVQTGPDPKATAANTRLIIATASVNKVHRQLIAHITLPTPGDPLKKIVIIRNFREGEYFGT